MIHCLYQYTDDYPLQCLESLGWLCFLLSAEESETVNVINLASDALRGDLEDSDGVPFSAKNPSATAPLVVQALSVWSLLATTTPDDYILETLVVEYLSLHFFHVVANGAH